MPALGVLLVLEVYACHSLCQTTEVWAWILQRLLLTHWFPVKLQFHPDAIWHAFQYLQHCCYSVGHLYCFCWLWYTQSALNRLCFLLSRSRASAYRSTTMLLHNSLLCHWLHLLQGVNCRQCCNAACRITECSYCFAGFQVVYAQVLCLLLLPLLSDTGLALQ